MTIEATSHNESAPAASGPSGIAHAIGARNLLIVIITMPLVFLMVVLACLAIFGKPGDKGSRAAAASVLSEPADEVLLQPELAMAGAIAPRTVVAAAPAPLILPSGDDITAMAIDGDRLVLRVKGRSGGSIVVYDLARGVEIQRIRVLENPVTDEGGL